MLPPAPSDPPIVVRGLASDGSVSSWVDAGPADGPCVVMIHGLPGSHRDFRWLAAPLEHAGLRVIRLDMPGFGHTAATRPSLSSLAEHLLTRLDRLGLERVVLLGHSFGGPQAMLAAGRDPARVRGLVLLAPVGLRRHQGLRAVPGLALVSRGLATPGVRRPLMAPVRAAFRRSGFPSSTPDAELRRSLAIASRVDFRVIANAATGVRIPTFLASCDDDPLIEPAIIEELGAKLPAGPRVRYATGGHNLQKTHAVELAEALDPWIRARLGG